MFNTQEFLQDNFPKPQNVLAMFSFYGFTAPTIPAVEKWFQRGAIPSAYLPLLFYIVEMEQGRPVSVKQYIGSYGVEEN